MNESSKKLAGKWPYPRYNVFKREVKQAAINWFDKHGFLEGKLAQGSVCILLNYYQFFREVLMALEMQGEFLLICDKRSPVFAVDGSLGKRGLFYFLFSLVPEHLQKHIKMITIQDILSEIKKMEGQTWVADFEEKYGLSF